MRKRELAIFTIIICIFSALIFASCDANPRPHDAVIHVNSAEDWNSALSSISTAPDGSDGQPAVFVIDITGNFSVNGKGAPNITGNYKEVQLTGGGTLSLQAPSA